jgi:sigma-B regulation protein RsbU (phosphoserine phosphatase)
MRDKLYLAGFLLVAGLLLFLGRDTIRSSVVITWGITFGGTTIAAVLLAAVYRFRLELNASRHELARKEAELSFALKVQQSLFPRQLPTGHGLEFSAVCIPASGISGDYYDILPLADGRLVFAVADISGKGISAAILMANLQALLRVVVTSTDSPAEVCRRLNHHLHQVTDAARFATLFYADWNQAERRLRYVNAGHNPPLLLGSLQGRALDKGGIPLGIMPEYPYETGEVFLEPDDMIILYSDGITEAGLNEGEEFGEKRLESLVSSLQKRPLGEIQKSILDAVRVWSGREPEDDMTLVIVRAVAETTRGGNERLKEETVAF